MSFSFNFGGDDIEDGGVDQEDGHRGGNERNSAGAVATVETSQVEVNAHDVRQWVGRSFLDLCFSVIHTVRDSL